jgi:protein subunit release factor B
MSKSLLFSVTKKDLVFEYFSGTGAGGQHRNKCQNSCRCKHPASGAVGICQEERSKEQNTKKAFRRMVESEKFQSWLRVEAARVTGELAEIEKQVDRQMQNIRVEVHDEDGRWLEVSANDELSKED